MHKDSVKVKVHYTTPPSVYDRMERNIEGSEHVYWCELWCQVGGVSEEKCSTSVSICARLRQSMETKSLRLLISIVKYVCLFVLRHHKVRSMAVEIASAGHRVIQKRVLPLLNF